MLNTFLLVVGLTTFLIAAMSIGVIFGRKPISGSCGGVAMQPGESCAVCGKGGCDDEDDERDSKSADLAYNAASDVEETSRHKN